MPPGLNHDKPHRAKTFPDWSGWLLIVLIAIALFAFVALAFYLFS